MDNQRFIELLNKLSQDQISDLIDNAIELKKEETVNLN